MTITIDGNPVLPTYFNHLPTILQNMSCMPALVELRVIVEKRSNQMQLLKTAILGFDDATSLSRYNPDFQIHTELMHSEEWERAYFVLRHVDECLRFVLMLEERSSDYESGKTDGQSVLGLFGVLKRAVTKSSRIYRAFGEWMVH